MIETSGEGGFAWLATPLGGINSSLKEREREMMAVMVKIMLIIMMLIMVLINMMMMMIVITMLMMVEYDDGSDDDKNNGDDDDGVFLSWVDFCTISDDTQDDDLGDEHEDNNDC